MRLDVMWRRDEYELVSWWPKVAEGGLGWVGTWGAPVFGVLNFGLWGRLGFNHGHCLE